MQSGWGPAYEQAAGSARLSRQSVTFNRGTEFARYGLPKSKLGVESYVCKPQARPLKGSLENANSRV